MRVLKGHKNPVGRVQFSPDSRRLLSVERLAGNRGFADGVRVWDLAAGTATVLPDGPGQATFTPDGAAVVAGFYKLALRAYDLASGTWADLAGPTETAVQQVPPLFTPDGTRALTQNAVTTDSPEADRFKFRWWAYPGWEPAGEVDLDPRPDTRFYIPEFFAAAFRPDGRTLAAVVYDGVLFYDPATGGRRKVPFELKQNAAFLAYSPDGSRLAAGTGTRVAVLDTDTGHTVAELTQTRKYFLSGAFTPDGRRFLTVSNEETAKAWDTASWGLAREYAWGAGPLVSVAVAPDGLTAAAGTKKGPVVVWDLDD